MSSLPLAPKRRRAALLGIGLDGNATLERVITGEHTQVLGGSAETHANLLDVMLRLEAELLALGRSLEDVEPDELAEIARRVDFPELEEIAGRLQTGIASHGVAFTELSADELNSLAAESLFSF